MSSKKSDTSFSSVSSGKDGEAFPPGRAMTTSAEDELQAILDESIAMEVSLRAVQMDEEGEEPLLLVTSKTPLEVLDAVSASTLVVSRPESFGRLEAQEQEPLLLLTKEQSSSYPTLASRPYEREGRWAEKPPSSPSLSRMQALTVPTATEPISREAPLFQGEGTEAPVEAIQASPPYRDPRGWNDREGTETPAEAIQARPGPESGKYRSSGAQSRYSPSPRPSDMPDFSRGMGVAARSPRPVHPSGEQARLGSLVASPSSETRRLAPSGEVPDLPRLGSPSGDHPRPSSSSGEEAAFRPPSASPSWMPSGELPRLPLRPATDDLKRFPLQMSGSSAANFAMNGATLPEVPRVGPRRERAPSQGEGRGESLGFGNPASNPPPSQDERKATAALLDSILRELTRKCGRAGFFLVQGPALVGFLARGRGDVHERIQDLLFPTEGPSLLSQAFQQRQVLRSSGPRLLLDQILAVALGGMWPRQMAAIPIFQEQKPHALLYLDDAGEEAFPDPFEEIEDLIRRVLHLDYKELSPWPGGER